MKEGVHKIKFRVKCDNRSHWIFIGVAAPTYSGFQNYLGASSYDSWGWTNAGSPGGTGKTYPSYNSYGTGFRTGDTVLMVVDMTNKTVQYALNSDTPIWGNAFSSISSEVCAAITTYDESDEVTLLVDNN
jgi:hypothetical protein